TSTPFPYTTLFRSDLDHAQSGGDQALAQPFSHEAAILPAPCRSDDHDAAAGEHDLGERVDFDIEMRRHVLRLLARQSAAKRRDGLIDLLSQIIGDPDFCRRSRNRLVNWTLVRLFLSNERLRLGREFS